MVPYRLVTSKATVPAQWLDHRWTFSWAALPKSFGMVVSFQFDALAHVARLLVGNLEHTKTHTQALMRMG